MGLEIEEDSYSGTDSKLFEEVNRIGIPGSSNTFHNLELPCDLNSILSSESSAQDFLSNSLLNKGLEGVFNPHNIKGGETQGLVYAGDQNSPGMKPGAMISTTDVSSTTNLHNQYQHNTNFGNDVDQGASALVLPVTPNIKTIPSSIAPHHPRPSIPRSSSLLRNEYLPDTTSSSPTTTTIAGQIHSQYATSSPSRYAMYPSGRYAAQSLRPFQGSNMSSSYPQFRGYNTAQQLGYGTDHQTASFQSPAYLSPWQYTYNSSNQISYGLDVQDVPQLEARQQSQQEEAAAQPVTPPNMLTSKLHMDQQTPNVGMPTPNSNSIKHEEAALALTSPLSQKVPRKGARRKSSALANQRVEDGLILTKTNEAYIEDLVDAMREDNQAEDNEGMKGTWTKMKLNQSERILEKCTDLLPVIKCAQREQSPGKKTSACFANFDKRIKEVCTTLRSQKTVCKHLLEPPYSHTVAGDPVYAAQRVRNNRKVNNQKRASIIKGREALGVKGQGKGKSMKKIDPATSHRSSDNEDSDDDPLADENETVDTPPPTKKEVPSRKKTKRTRKPASDDDYDDDAARSPAPKKVKRERRRVHKPVENDVEDSGSPQDDRLRALDSSPSQFIEPADNQSGAYQFNYYGNNDFSSSPTASAMPSTLAPQFYNDYTYDNSQYGHFPNHPSWNQSSMGHPTVPDPNILDQTNGGNELNTSDFTTGFDLLPLGHPGSS